MAAKEDRKEQVKAWLAVLMAWVAGCLDAIGYLSLAHMFTAHMSGNSAAMGAHLGTGEWASALHRAFPIPIFVAGVAFGATLVEWGHRRGLRSPFTPTFALEAALLLAFMLLGNRLVRGGEVRTSLWRYYGLASLPVLAMGMQNATLRRVAGHGVRTTYVSGMLTNLAEESVAYLFWLVDRLRDGAPGSPMRLLRASWEQSCARQVVLYAGIWSAFASGAVLGGWAEQQWALIAVALPLGGLAVVLTADLIRPLGASATPPRRNTE